MKSHRNLKLRRSGIIRDVAPTELRQHFVLQFYKDSAPTVLAANRELGTRFAQKLQAILARIWGEPAPAALEA